MSLQDKIAGSIDGCQHLLEWHLSDFSDADMLVRPVENANHTAWQLGHVAYFNIMVAKIVDASAQFATPANFDTSHGGRHATSNDVAHFPTKTELLTLLKQTSQTISAAVRKINEAELDQPSPESLRSFAATIGDLMLLIPSHVSMHIGQIQVIRRKLGKPVLI